MGIKNFIKKSISFVSAAAMALTMVVMPVGSSASYAAEGTEKEPIYVNKTAKLQSDGTYKITLESYVTGNVTVDTTYTTTPCDIVLVLDQSGSMKENMSNTTRLGALQTAANNFIDGVAASAKKTGADHRIAIVGFAGDGNEYGKGKDYQGKYMNTELFIGSNQYNYGGNNRGNGSNQATAANTQYGNALQSVKTQKNTIDESIKNLAANGGTYPQYGLEMANGIFNAYKNKNDDTYQKEDGTTEKRNKIVVVFTDGAPGELGNTKFDTSVANSALSQAKSIKDATGTNAKIYSVGIFNGADASANPEAYGTSSANKFMHFISSNYPNAESMANPGTRDSEGAYYKSASNASDLNNIFEEIAHDTVGGSASIALGKEAVSRDVISDNFDLPAGITNENVKDYVNVSTVNYLGGGKWSTTKEPINDSAIISVDQDKKTFNVSNFDFSANYVGEGTSQGGQTKARGKKLVIEITGVTARHSGEDMKTNNTTSSTSGIYKGNTLVKAYNEPTVSIPDKNYVLDYGKTVVSNTIKYDCGISNVKLYNTVKPSPHEKSTTGKYGTFDLTNVTNGGTITYTPGKINWDGFDSAYVFGEVNKDEYLWSAVNFIPATSVYYEDDFGTDGNTDSNVAIVWTGSWSKDGTSQSETQSDKNSQYGWDDSYKDDTGYSNGSAHYSSQKLASATFRFTGTGVDVYSRTNEGVGKISTSLKKVTKNADGTETVKTIKYKSIDNLSVSGDYYQIPTLNYDDLDYGTYEVTIKVAPVSSENRGTYYLDGIRVYNPLGEVDTNSTAGKAYKEAGESNAQYIQVRKDLLDSSKVQAIDTAIQGSLFIDKLGAGTTEIGTYKDYGPKNEVYLKSDTEKNKIQGVAFNINGYSSEKNKVFIGLKSPTGKEVTVKVTSGDKVEEIKLKSAADLYYEITPTEDGNVVIENMSDNLLSITKVRITGENLTANGYALTSTPELMSYVNTFDTLQEKQDTNQKDTEDTLDKGDVDINNSGDNDTNKDNSSQDNNEQTKPDNTWNKIMNSIKSWFRK